LYEVEQIRRARLALESNLRGVGSFCIIGGALSLLSMLPKLPATDAMLGAAMSVLVVVTGLLLHELKPVGRIVYSTLAAVSVGANVWAVMRMGSTLPPLLWVPIVVQSAVIIGIVVFLWHPRSSEIFSREFREHVIGATRHIKPGAPWFVIALVIIVFAAIAVPAVITLSAMR
jgi:hypothetical protein